MEDLLLFAAKERRAMTDDDFWEEVEELFLREEAEEITAEEADDAFYELLWLRHEQVGELSGNKRWDTLLALSAMDHVPQSKKHLFDAKGIPTKEAMSETLERES
jgi:hypothetical protein